MLIDTLPYLSVPVWVWMLLVDYSIAFLMYLFFEMRAGKLLPTLRLGPTASARYFAEAFMWSAMYPTVLVAFSAVMTIPLMVEHGPSLMQVGVVAWIEAVLTTFGALIIFCNIVIAGFVVPVVSIIILLIALIVMVGNLFRKRRNRPASG